MTQLALAEDHNRKRIALLERSSSKALQAWRGIDVGNLDLSWLTIGAAITAAVADAQQATALQATAYVGQVAREAQTGGEAVRVNPQAVSGVDGSGRDLNSFLFGAVTTTKQAIGAGMSLTDATLSGSFYLSSMLKTALADIGRGADATASVGRSYTHYVRVVSAGACSRCAILAGISSYQRAFQRHPACKCTAAPETDFDDSLYSSPINYFESLDAKEQDRVFTKSGAEAIRAGADPVKVVSARRGAGISDGADGKPGFGRSMTRTTVGYRPDGSPIQVFTTAEGTTIRGRFGYMSRETGDALQRLQGSRYRTTKRIRVMPESIIAATDDPELRKVLLRDAGYLDYPISNYSSNSWVAEHRQIRLNDRRIADEFWRSIGISLGG